MTNEIEKIENTELKTVDSESPFKQILTAAIDKGIDIETLRELIQLNREAEADIARKAYFRAMSGFRKVAPVIGKDQTVDYPKNDGTRTTYDHASLGHALHIVNPLLSELNLTYSWITKQENGLIFVTCTVTHADGYSESTTLFGAPDTSGGKNNIQGIGSTVSYLERYTLFSILGLASTTQDNDGKPPTEYNFISDKEAATISDMIESTGSNRGKFLTWLQAGAISEIHSSDYKRAFDALKSKEKK